MARVRLTDQGALYEAFGPILEANNPAFLRVRGVNVPRLPATREDVRILLSSPEAERYHEEDPETWGKLPAWCWKCDTARWVPLEVLRRGGPGVLL
jgi:hypothetical protein